MFSAFRSITKLRSVATSWKRHQNVASFDHDHLLSICYYYFFFARFIRCKDPETFSESLCKRSLVFWRTQSTFSMQICSFKNKAQIINTFSSFSKVNSDVLKGRTRCPASLDRSVQLGSLLLTRVDRHWKHLISDKSFADLLYFIRKLIKAFY